MSFEELYELEEKLKRRRKIARRIKAIYRFLKKMVINKL